MNSKHLLAAAGLVVLITGYMLLKSDNKSTSGLQSSTPIQTIVKTTPSPIPILTTIDAKSNLKEELEKLVPDDNSSDFKALYDEVNKL